VRWLRGSRSHHARKPDAPLAVRADDAALDEHCRATLQKLVAAGCTRANEPCSIEQFQVAEQELHHLKQHGFVHAEGSALLHPVLRSYERLRNGADVGKINVVLNVDLY
jgi:N-acetylglutamate synthase-like GNAT family acetyltransferase